MKSDLSIWLFAALATICFSTASARAQIIDTLPMDGYAAVVNERTITIGDVMLSTYEAQERLRLRYSGDELKSRREELFYAGLENVIDHSLIIEEFKSQEGVIPERTIDDQINDIIYNRFDNDKPALLAALIQDGITLEEWRENIRERIIVAAMRRNEIANRVVVSPKQIVDAYNASQDRYSQPEQVKLRLIFLNAGTDPEAAFKRIQDTREKIVNGASFESLARKVSQDASSAAGGDWGWIEPGELREELRTAIADLPLQKVSEPVYTPEGYYLLQVEERSEASTKSLDDVQIEIERELREKESERLYSDWMKRLRRKHSVLYYIPRPPDAS